MNTPSQREVNWQPHHKKQQESTCTDPSISHNAQLGEVKRGFLEMLRAPERTYTHVSKHHTVKARARRSACFTGVISHPRRWATGARGLPLIHLPALKWKSERQRETEWEDVICIYRNLRLRWEQVLRKTERVENGKNDTRPSSNRHLSSFGDTVPQVPASWLAGVENNLVFYSCRPSKLKVWGVVYSEVLFSSTQV